MITQVLLILVSTLNSEDSSYISVQFSFSLDTCKPRAIYSRSEHRDVPRKQNPIISFSSPTASPARHFPSNDQTDAFAPYFSSPIKPQHDRFTNPKPSNHPKRPSALNPSEHKAPRRFQPLRIMSKPNFNISLLFVKCPRSKSSGLANICSFNLQNMSRKRLQGQ